MKTFIYANEYHKLIKIFAFKNEFENYILKVEEVSINNKVKPMLFLHFENEKDLDVSCKDFIKMIKKAGFKKL